MYLGSKGANQLEVSTCLVLNKVTTRFFGEKEKLKMQLQQRTYFASKKMKKKKRSGNGFSNTDLAHSSEEHKEMCGEREYR